MSLHISFKCWSRAMFSSIVLMEYTTVEWSRWNSCPMAYMLMPVTSRMMYIVIWRAALTLALRFLPRMSAGITL